MTNALLRRSWILAFALSAPISAQTLSPIAFGNQIQGTTSPAMAATLKNTNTVALSITNIAVTGNFAKSGGTCPLSPAKLAKGASCTILVTFTPAALGPLTGKVTVTDNAANSPQSAKLSGTGVAPVTISPASWNFGKLPLDEISAVQNFTVTNNQTAAFTFNSITTTGDFKIATNTCSSGIGAAPATCTVGVTFSPTATGARTGSLVFSDHATNSPQTAALTGSGTAAALVSIAVTPANPTIYVGSTEQFTATGTYSNGNTKVLAGVTWTATPLGLASISTSGLATGLAPGSPTITAAQGTITGSTTLMVVQVFVNTGSLNTARYYHSATLLTTGLVLAAGGIGYVPGGTGALGELASAELYNPGTKTFTLTGSLNAARDEHSATLLNDGTVLIAGGSGGSGELASAELYNAATAAFTPTTGNLTTARYEHTATILPNGSVLIAGGYGAAGVLASAEVYNPATGIFTPTGNLNAARFDATATPLPNGLVLIAGGANTVGPVSSAELYDPNARTFTYTTGSLNVARSGATATLLNTGSVLIADGYNYLTTGPLTSAELYNPTSQTFTPTGSLASTGWLGTATLLGNSNVLVAGSVLNSAATEIYNPASGAFSTTTGLNTPGDLQTATLLPDGTVLIAGGHSNTGGTVLAAAELYEPPSLSPPNLVSIAIAPSNPTLAIGAGQQLIATGTFADNSTQNLASVYWTSSNPTVATVTDDETNSGVVYGVGVGNTILSACSGTICQVTLVTVTGGDAVRR